MMRHAIIIRMAYQEDHPNWPWRLAFFQSMCLERLLRQSDQRFDIWVRCLPHHDETIKSLNPRIKTFYDQYPRYYTQTRIDCDDLVHRHFVARIHKEIAKQPDKPLLVSFQPYKLDLHTLKRHRMGQRYNAKSTSMFLSLYQPSITGENFKWIYDYNHSKISGELGFPVRVVTIPEGYCDHVIHGENKLSTIKKGDVPLEIQKPRN